MASIDYVPSTLGVRWGGPEPEDTVKERAALWSVYSHRFFGSARPMDEAPFAFSPMACDEACMCLEELAGRGAVTSELLERSLSQLLIAGYRPGSHCREAFERLSVSAAGRSELPVDTKTWKADAQQRQGALKRLWWVGQRDYGRNTPHGAANPDLRVQPEAKGYSEDANLIDLVTSPTELSYRGGAVTVSKEMWARRHLEDVGPRLDPRRWDDISLFITDTERHDVAEPPDATGPWNGAVAETFDLSWNQLRFTRFQPVLDIDYTESGGEYKADFSLAYEQDDQLVVDDGFVMAEKVRGRPGWTHFQMVKTIKFASAFLNFLVPAALTMWVESDSIDFLERATRSERLAARRGSDPTQDTNRQSRSVAAARRHGNGSERG